MNTPEAIATWAREAGLARYNDESVDPVNFEPAPDGMWVLWDDEDLARFAEKAQARLLELLAHAVKEADGWHDDAHGGPLTGDPLIEEARAIIKAEGA